MGWLGLILIFMGTPHFPAFDDFWTRYVFLASILIWAAISFVLSKRKLQDWLVWGFLSPCLGSLIVAPPASIAVVMINAHIVFPVGIATGAMMWLIFNLPRRNLVGQCDFQSPSRIVDANTAPSSLGQRHLSARPIPTSTNLGLKNEDLKYPALAFNPVADLLPGARSSSVNF